MAAMLEVHVHLERDSPSIDSVSDFGLVPIGTSAKLLI